MKFFRSLLTFEEVDALHTHTHGNAGAAMLSACLTISAKCELIPPPTHNYLLLKQKTLNQIVIDCSNN